MAIGQQQTRSHGPGSWGRQRWLAVTAILVAIAVVIALLVVYAGGGSTGGGGY